MKLSVIIPTYNRATLIKRAVDSVLQQVFPASEVIVVDDGSTDNTSAVLSDYGDKIRLINCPINHGVSAARNKGIALARHDWIAFLDSDDAWHSAKLQSQVAALEKNPDYRICHTNEIWYRNGQRVNEMKKHRKQGGNIFQACLALCLISPSSVLLHRQLLDEVEFFDTELPACEDYDLWLRITARYPVLYLPERLTLKYGGHSDQLSHRYWGMDRFRIQSLCKLLKYDYLTLEQRQAVIVMIKEKVGVYLIGARKRNKQEEVLFYEQLLGQI